MKSVPVRCCAFIVNIVVNFTVKRNFTNCFPASTFDFEQVIPGWNGLKILYIAVAKNKHFMIELQGQNYTFISIGINFILRTMTMKPPKKQKHVQTKNRL